MSTREESNERSGSTQGRASDDAYQADTVRSRTVALLGIASTVALVAVLGGSSLFLDWLRGPQRPETSPEVDVGTRRTQARVGDELRDLRAMERRLLTQYQVVDRETGVYRIPIDRAIDRLLDSGLPVRDRPEEGESK